MRVRRSINAIWQDYKNGNQKELINLIRAWKGIFDVSAKDPDAHNSFFKIGGMHGEPFRGAGYANAAWWGGYCNHGNVLFPTWHRAYILHLENALRSIPGCEDVTLPYWDETGEDTKENGVPGIFLEPKFVLDGVEIDNPLYSFTFPQNIVDRVDQDETDPDTYNLYIKAKGYKTVRYPLSGLVGTPVAQENSNAHNAKFPPDVAAKYLNQNVKDWLNHAIIVKGEPVPTNTRVKYENCLHAPNYTVFSNTTSAQAWNDLALPEHQVVPLESPHNDIHLAVGGFQVGSDDFSPVSGANGDMGENDTAGLDPIFYFHHCNVDLYFWLWQREHQSTDHLDIIPEYAGTNSVDSQGPTPGVPGGIWLTIDSELQPFTKPSSDDKVTYKTSRDVVNIESQLDYTYEIPGKYRATLPKRQRAETSVKINGVKKSQIAGSHQLVVYAKLPGDKKKQIVAVESVLSRWHVNGCKNCQLTQDVKTHALLHGIRNEDLEKGNVEVSVDVVTRAGTNSGGGRLGATPIVPRFELIGKGGRTFSGTAA